MVKVYTARVYDCAVFLTIIYRMLSLFLSSILVEIVGSELVVKPRNTAIVVGTPLALECLVANNSIVRNWWIERFSDRQMNSDSKQHQPKEEIFINWGNNGAIVIRKNFSHFAVEVDSYGSGILYSNRSRLSDAGIYTCAIDVGLNIVYYSAEVIILHEIPQCEASFKEGDLLEEDHRIWLHCNVTFKGSWVPAIQWKLQRLDGKFDSDQEEMLKKIDQNVIDSSMITSNISIIISSTTNFSHYSGTVYFPPSNRTLRTGADTNPPSFNYTWTSPMIQVIPRNISTEEYVGDVVTLLVLGVVSLVVLIAVTGTATLYIRAKRQSSGLPAKDNSSRFIRPKDHKLKSTETKLIPYDNGGVVNESRHNVIIEADGTEYMKFAEAKGILQSDANHFQATHFNTSTYADINHFLIK